MGVRGTGSIWRGEEGRETILMHESRKKKLKGRRHKRGDTMQMRKGGKGLRDGTNTLQCGPLSFA